MTDNLFPNLIPERKGVKDIHGKVQHGAYAYFPGTGPQGKTCRTCEHRQQVNERKSICLKWREPINSPGPIKKQPAISINALACKYFSP